MSNLQHHEENIKLERIEIHYKFCTVVEDYDEDALTEYKRVGWRPHQQNNTIHLLHPIVGFGRA